MVLILTEKQNQKISLNGTIVIPKKWGDKLDLNDTNLVEMELFENKVILIRKKKHPLEIEDNLFDGVSPFSDKELAEVKKKLFPIED